MDGVGGGDPQAGSHAPGACRMTPIANPWPPSAARLPLCVGVRHRPGALSVRVAYIAGAAPAGADTQDTQRQFAQVLATTERLVHEAGASLDGIVSCEVFVREPAACPGVEALLHTWAARRSGCARLVRQPPCATPHADLGMALVVARPATPAD
ncbi:hypothetical protein ASF16_10655 [Acidovorax sp. Leaf78]|nr:hypothetical protein ASF16_10655 [Acidovorax sp. Leaf78]